MYKKCLKSNRGITLIALVVTIIVLIILAGISINLILGENGIIKKATNSKEATIIAREKENIRMAYQKAKMELDLTETKITAEGIEEELKKYTENVKVEEIEQSAIGDLEIVVNIESATDFAEITFEETTHKYVVALPAGEVSKVKNITFTYNPPLNEWTKDEVVVTASTNLEGYTIETSANGEDWASTNIQTYSENGKVYARLVKDGVQQEDVVEGEVTNIDKNNPTVGTLLINSYGEDWVEVTSEDEYYEKYYDHYGQPGCIKLKEGEDLESGHKSTTYTVIAYFDFWYLEYEGDMEEEKYLELSYTICENSQEMIDIDEFYDTKESELMEEYGEGAIGCIEFYIQINTVDKVGNTISSIYECLEIYMAA